MWAGEMGMTRCVEENCWGALGIGCGAFDVFGGGLVSWGVYCVLGGICHFLRMAMRRALLSAFMRDYAAAAVSLDSLLDLACGAYTLRQAGLFVNPDEEGNSREV